MAEDNKNSRETVIVDRGERSSAGGLITIIVIVLVVLLLLWIFGVFGGGGNGTTDPSTDVEIETQNPAQ